MIDVRELKMETMSRSHKEKMISITVNPESIKMPKYRTNVADKPTDPVICPRCVDEVYSLGISLQNYIGDIYLKLAEINKENNNYYTHLVQNQLDVKTKLEKLAHENLNSLLAYFYENGGPIIEPLVSEETATHIQSFINRIVNSFLIQMDCVTNRAFKGEISASDLDNEINGHIISMYTAMRLLFHVDEMQNAFKELISARNI